jgi:hypothetical protein
MNFCSAFSPRSCKQSGSLIVAQPKHTETVMKKHLIELGSIVSETKGVILPALPDSNFLFWRP